MLNDYDNVKWLICKQGGFLKGFELAKVGSVITLVSVPFIKNSVRFIPKNVVYTL